MTTTPATDRAADLRARLVDELRTGAGAPALDLPAPVWEAMLAAPRHLFCPPGTPLEEAYADDIVRTRRDEKTGRTLSSLSAPWLQVRMLAQAAVEPGMRVLEIGSGPNAAMLAHLVGTDGEVVTVDIDPVVTESTRAALAATGYDDRVTALCADGALPLDMGPFDRIIVTMGVWDIPAAWLDQLTPDGIIVVPLRLRHPNECWSIAFHRTGDLLVGKSAIVCGFVDAQGVGALRPAKKAVTIAGIPVTVTAWDPTTDVTALPATVDLDGTARVDSGVVLAPPGSFVGMRTHLALDMPGLAQAVFDNARMAREALNESWANLAYVDGDSMALVAWWPAEGGHELGARGTGPRAQQAAETLATQIRQWDQAGRPQRAAHVYRPAGSSAPLTGTVVRLPGGGHLAVTQHHDRIEEI